MRGRLLVGLVLALWTPSCSGKVQGEEGGGPDAGVGGSPSTQPDGSTEDADPAAIDAACRSFAAAQCGQTAECMPFWMTYWYAGVQDCVNRAMLICPAALAAHGSSAPARFEQCAAALQLSSCEAVTARDPGPQECDLAGALPVGARCGAGTQCVDGCCSLVEGTSCGACKQRSVVGSSCEQTEECPSGSDCYQGVCTAAVGLGEDCTFGPCQQDADCRNGVCEKRLGPGEACDEMLDRRCDFSRGLMCNPYTKRCEELLIAGHGEPCGWVVGDGGVERYALCREGGVCVDEYPSGTGLCRLPAADGAPCDGSLDFPCRSPAMCLGAACTIPDVLACE